MGDFTGFTFGDWHSTDPETGLVTVLRVSGGDRYEEEIHPDIKDITAEVPGVDGEYYFGSNYGPKKINIEIAFDSLTEEQFRQMRRVFGTRKIKDLIFDERPYKKYMAKIESPVELSYVCFDEPKKIIGAERDGVRRITRIEEEVVIDEETGEPAIDEETGESITELVTYRDLEQVTPYELQEGTMRIYKGEGKISFICYFPFAKSVYKVIPYSYQHTTDTEIQVDKKYFKLEDSLYVLVDEPNVSEIDIYYERVINKECEEWAISSGIKKIDKYEYEAIDTYKNGEIKVYNPGDLLVGFRLYIPSGAAVASDITLAYGDSTLSLEKMTLLDSESGILIDTNNQVIVGVKDGQPTKSLYNRYIKSGSFFKFEPNGKVETLEITGGSEGITIEYDYLYF